MKNVLIIMVFTLVLVIAGCSNKQKEQALSENKNQSQVNTTNSIAQNNYESLTAKNPGTGITRARKGRAARMRKFEKAKNLKTGTAISENNAKVNSAAAPSEKYNSDAALEAQIKEGKAILISNENESAPLETQGDKVYAINMPDGKLYPAELDGGKKMITVHGHGKMESRMIKGKMYLFDKDNNKYAVKVVNNKLVAVIDNTKENNIASQ